MDISMDKPPGGMSLAELEDCCSHEMSKFRNKEQSDDQYCLEIFRRAIQFNDEYAWQMLHDQYTETVRIWFRRHNSRDTALRHMKEDDYVSRTFERFWQAVRRSKPDFETLAGALSYLQLCLTSTILDTIRDFARPNLMPLPDYGHPDDSEFEVEDIYHEGELWEVLQSILPSEKEQRVAYLLFHCNLKAREIIRYCPGEFKDASEIHSLRRNILERILRNADKIRWKLSDEEK